MTKKLLIYCGCVTVLFVLVLVVLLNKNHPIKGFDVPVDVQNVSSDMDVDETKPYLSIYNVAVNSDWKDTVYINDVSYNAGTLMNIEDIFELKAAGDVITIISEDSQPVGKFDLNKFDISVYGEVSEEVEHGSTVGLGSTYDSCAKLLGEPSLDLYEKEKKIYYISEGKMLNIEFRRGDTSYLVSALYVSDNL